MSSIVKYQAFVPAIPVKLDLPPRPANTRSLFDLLQGVGITKWELNGKQFRPFHHYGIDADTVWTIYVAAVEKAAKELGKTVYRGNHGRSYVTPYLTDADFEELWNSGAIQAEVHANLAHIWASDAGAKATVAMGDFKAIQPNN